jgi:hypothetical protein
LRHRRQGPHFIRMDVVKLMCALEAAWSHALPGREVGSATT